MTFIFITDSGLFYKIFETFEYQIWCTIFGEVPTKHNHSLTLPILH